MMRFGLAIVLSVAMAQSFGQKPESALGTICGSVRDEAGQPAALVRVAAIYLGGSSGPRPGSTTDQQGRYCIRGVRVGEYVVSANDPEKGYPEMMSLFFALHLPGERVTLTAANLNGQSDVQIPFKAGFLRIVLTDALSGKGIDAMSYELAHQSDPQHRYLHGSSGSAAPLLVPPNETMTLSVTSPGYSTWPDDGSKVRELTLLPGETRVLHVALRPVDR